MTSTVMTSTVNTKNIFSVLSGDPALCGKTEQALSRSYKDEVAKKLNCTKVCTWALKNPATGEYGTCYRQFEGTCTFAHSLEELNDPMCTFDKMCKYKQGRYNKEGTFDVTLKCKFRHSSETREEWLKRTGKKLPDLPYTLGSEYKKKTRTNFPSHNKFPPPSGYEICMKEALPTKKVNKNLQEVPVKELHIIKVPSDELDRFLAIKEAFENGSLIAGNWR